MAYLAVTGYKLDDSRPYLYKTSDHGKHWRRLDEVLASLRAARKARQQIEGIATMEEV